MNELTIHAILTASQLLTFCLIGYICAKCKVITEQDTKAASNILAVLVNCCLLVALGFKACSSENYKDMLWVFLLTTIAQCLGFVVAMLIMKKKGNPNYWIECSLAGPSNCGFIGIAIITLMIGDGAVIYVVGGIISSNILIFTIANWTISGQYNSDSIKNYLKSPIFICMMIGVILLITQPPLPGFLTGAITSVGDMGGPLALVVCGATLAKMDFKRLLKNINTYKVMFIKLIVCPLIIIPFLKLIPGLGEEAALVALVLSACPSPSMPVIFSIQYEKDSAYAAALQALSMVFVMFSLPLVVYIYSMI